MFLETEEVNELTGKKRKSAQIRALRSMGIEHKIRPDGTVAVSRNHVEKILGGSIPESDTIKEKFKPDWSALYA